ncbi:MAG: polysaccharide deacetylase family protein [Anaerolineae bacterium]|nr:polysaccharide deacetylase family protein [Anaerolineae bacterium]
MRYLTYLLLLFLGFIAAACTQTAHLEAASGGATAVTFQTATPQPVTGTAVPLPTFTPLPATTTPSSSPIPPATAATRPTQTPLPTATLTNTPTPTPTLFEACRPETATVPHLSIAPGPWSRPLATTNVIHHGPRDNRQFIHLSFDVEGHASVLGALLNVLDKHQVKTTMFIVGSWAEANSSWLSEIAWRGHEFGNHSYSHTHLRQLTPEQIQTELQQTEAIVLNLTGQSTKPWLRPPYGGYSEETVQAAYTAGWTTVMWSGHGLDTSPDADERTICNTLMQHAEPGAILLLHTSNPAVVTAVDRFITEMHAQGYTFVPLSVLMVGN